MVIKDDKRIKRNEELS